MRNEQQCRHAGRKRRPPAPAVTPAPPPRGLPSDGLPRHGAAPLLPFWPAQRSHISARGRHLVTMRVCPLQDAGPCRLDAPRRAVPQCLPILRLRTSTCAPPHFDKSRAKPHSQGCHLTGPLPTRALFANCGPGRCVIAESRRRRGHVGRWPACGVPAVREMKICPFAVPLNSQCLEGWVHREVAPLPLAAGAHSLLAIN